MKPRPARSRFSNGLNKLKMGRTTVESDERERRPFISHDKLFSTAEVLSTVSVPQKNKPNENEDPLAFGLL